MKKLLFAVAVFAFLAVACEPAQSELTINSVKNKAQVVGTVKYNSGTKKNEDGTFTDNVMENASNVEVVARIAYSNYGGGKGNYVIKAKTNAKGEYTLEIPVGSEALNATIECLPFYKTKYVKDATSGDVKPISNALYNVFAGGSTISLDSEQIKSVNFTVTSTATLE